MVGSLDGPSSVLNSLYNCNVRRNLSSPIFNNLSEKIKQPSNYSMMQTTKSDEDKLQSILESTLKPKQDQGGAKVNRFAVRMKKHMDAPKEKELGTNTTSSFDSRKNTDQSLLFHNTTNKDVNATQNASYDIKMDSVITVD